MFFGRHRAMSLISEFHPPEFDPELCIEIIGCIEEKTSLEKQAAADLAVHITTSIGYLCAAFEEDFVKEIDALVGSDAYAVRVYLSRDNQIQL